MRFRLMLSCIQKQNMNIYVHVSRALTEKAWRKAQVAVSNQFNGVIRKLLVNGGCCAHTYATSFVSLFVETQSLVTKTCNLSVPRTSNAPIQQLGERQTTESNDRKELSRHFRTCSRQHGSAAGLHSLETALAFKWAWASCYAQVASGTQIHYKG